MPELPEVETIISGLRPHLEGFSIKSIDVRRHDLRFPVPRNLSKRILGSEIEAIKRRGKYILVFFENSKVLIIHLGMSGKIILNDLNEKENKHSHVIFTLNSGKKFMFNDPRRFGMVILSEKNKYLYQSRFKNMGPEPLNPEFNYQSLLFCLAGKKAPIKNVLLDQRTVAGIGNIYACESLFLAGVSPTKQAGRIKQAKAERLVLSIKTVLKKAIDAGGSSIKNFVKSSGEMGYFQNSLAVYGRVGKQCPDCNCRVGIKCIKQSGRSTFYCPKKQK
tara:strand:- start:325 stop:1152 length:828 start_codon:yes stop_codon:yes gene_type:complete